MSKYQVSANGQEFGIYEATNKQEARNACAQDAGYKNEWEIFSAINGRIFRQAETYEIAIEEAKTLVRKHGYTFGIAKGESKAEYFDRSKL